MVITKATEKGQVVIPVGLRRKYHITAGTRLAVLDKDGAIVLKPLFKEPVREARGMLKGGGSALKALMEDRIEEASG